MQFDLPIHWNRRIKGKPVRYTLSLNLALSKGYRWYQTRKKHFSKECKKQLTGKEPRGLSQVRSITYHIGCSGKQDLMNVGSIIDKFFQDFLVSEGILKDDNIKVVTNVSFIGEWVKPSDSYAKVDIQW